MRRLQAPDERLCPVCKGMRFLTYDVPYGHELFNRLVRCQVCSSDEQQRYLEALCGLSPEMLGWTFANTRRTEANGPAFDRARALAAHPAWFYTLTGPYGVGKTRLLACLVNAGRTLGWVSVYTTTAELLDHLRRAYARDAPMGFDATWEKVAGARILALDEFDRWNPTQWAEEKFFELLEQRYRNGETRLTAFASNAGLDDLPGYIASRMSDRRCAVYELGGADLRLIRR